MLEKNFSLLCYKILTKSQILNLWSDSIQNICRLSREVEYKSNLKFILALINEKYGILTPFYHFSNHTTIQVEDFMFLDRWKWQVPKLNSFGNRIPSGSRSPFFLIPPGICFKSKPFFFLIGRSSNQSYRNNLTFREEKNIVCIKKNRK